MNSRLHQVFDGIRALEPWSPVALRVLQLAARADVVPDELVAVIGTDAALTARVLRLCNSAFYGFQREIGSLREAGNLLGADVLVSLVMTSCTGRFFRGAGGEHEARRELWERSILTALAAELVAEVHGGVDRPRAYTGGLLANIGELVVLGHVQGAAERIRAYRRAGLERLEAEQRVIGLHHGQIGGRMARRWRFPEELVDCIANHPTPERAMCDPELVGVVHVAETIADALKLEHEAESERRAYERAERRAEPGPGPDPGALARLGVDSTGLAELQRTLRGEFERARALIETAV